MDMIEKNGMLDLMDRPAFSVGGGVILYANQAARQRLITPGNSVLELFLTGKDDYEAFSGGCLYLTLSLAGQTCGASVSRIGDTDVFILEDETDLSELNALALASREIRGPLTNIMAVADQTLPKLVREDEASQIQLAQLNRGLYQLLRLVGNMSDALRYCTATNDHSETVELRAFLDELLCTAAALAGDAGKQLHHTNLRQPLYCLIDREMLERALNNMISNAMKFTPRGGSIDVQCTRRGDRLYLSVADTGDGIPSGILGSVFTRYRREPALEDNRYGIGLGLVLVRAAAARHGGTVLIDRPEGWGTRITLSIAIRKADQGAVRSRGLHMDYAGERNHALTELSDVLPAQQYRTEDINGISGP